MTAAEVAALRRRVDHISGEQTRHAMLARVVVQDGGQAIVGAVSAGAGVPGRGEG